MEIPESLFAPGVILVAFSFVVIALLYMIQSARRSSRKDKSDRTQDHLRNLDT
jgi:ABC-type Co2+ transport system permease subunit